MSKPTHHTISELTAVISAFHKHEEITRTLNPMLDAYKKPMIDQIKLNLYESAVLASTKLKELLRK